MIERNDNLLALLCGATPKQFLDGTHRAVAPEETWDRVAPLLPRFGITRVANVTGLDRIGIPVVMVVRPNARTLAVSQGKGRSLAAARVSGVMESLEDHHAERATPPVRLARYEELAGEAVVVDPALLPRSASSIYSPRLALPWVEGIDLMAREAAWVPFELVHANASLPRLPGSGAFQCTTNGLAAGNTPAEAACHALLELVERDALALFDHTGEAGRAALRIDLDGVDDDGCRALIDRFAAADVGVAAWNVTSDVGVPVVRVVISDRAADAELNPMPAAFGSGAHPARHIALSRALTEAAQSRLTAITGARDDFTRRRYRAFSDHAVLARHRALAAEAGTLRWTSLPTFAGATVEEDLGFVLAGLRAAGCARAVAVDLSRPGLPFFVMRAVVSGLEGTTEGASYRPGARARARQEATRGA
ncbi:MAG TPA: YcaO-like family protein [Polyangia bacterium]|jgi:ribosomal protein S12 methylthiotransferase accessory factor